MGSPYVTGEDTPPWERSTYSLTLIEHLSPTAVLVLDKRPPPDFRILAVLKTERGRVWWDWAGYFELSTNRYRQLHGTDHLYVSLANLKRATQLVKTLSPFLL